MKNFLIYILYQAYLVHVFHLPKIYKVLPGVWGWLKVDVVFKSITHTLIKDWYNQIPLNSWNSNSLCTFAIELLIKVGNLSRWIDSGHFKSQRKWPLPYAHALTAISWIKSFHSRLIKRMFKWFQYYAHISNYLFIRKTRKNRHFDKNHIENSTCILYSFQLIKKFFLSEYFLWKLVYVITQRPKTITSSTHPHTYQKLISHRISWLFLDSLQFWFGN